MKKRMFIMAAALLLVFGGIFGWKAFIGFQIEKALSNREPPPVTVATTQAERKVWQSKLQATGSLQSVRGVDVTTEVAGKVAAIEFESGQAAKQGDVLIRLDSQVDRAELQGLQADAEEARLNLERKQELVDRELGSQASLDTARAQYQRARAAVRSKQVLINKKTIEAPFDGVLGIRQVDLGEYLAPGTAVVPLQTLDPIYLDFSLPQQQFDKVREGQTVRLVLEGVRNQALDDEGFTGTIIAISPKVESGTRSFGLRAQVENPNRRLRPGMFGRVEVILDDSREVITLPQTAITYNPYGNTVFKVVEENAEGSEEPVLRAKRVNVRTGETRADQVQILAGLEPGEEVVVAGQLKLRGGDRINVDNSVVPESKAELEDVQNY